MNEDLCLSGHTGNAIFDALVVNFHQVEPGAKNDILALTSISARGTESREVRKTRRCVRLREFFKIAYTNPYLVLASIAYHMCRMESIGTLNFEDARLLAEESEAIYIPLCQMFGIWQMRKTIGIQGVTVLEPNLLRKAEDHLRETQGAREKAYDITDRFLNRMLAYRGTEVGWEQRELNLYSVCQRALRGTSLDDSMHHIKVEVLARTERLCFEIRKDILRGLEADEQWEVDRDTNINLLDRPRFNGYRALEIVAHWCDRGHMSKEFVIEFYIATEQMASVNREGILAGVGTGGHKTIGTTPWWCCDALREIVRGNEVPRSDSQIYVFSPTGQIYLLERESTPIDYAYCIHPHLGNHCLRVFVNGKAVPYSIPLSNGDIVEIQTDPDYHAPVRTWRDVVKTPRAAQHIQHQMRQLRIEMGRSRLHQKIDQLCRRHQMRSIPQDRVDRFIERLAIEKHYFDSAGLCLDLVGEKPALTSDHDIAERIIAMEAAMHLVRADGFSLGIGQRIEAVRFGRCKHQGDQCTVVISSPPVGCVEEDENGRKELVVYSRKCPDAPRETTAISLGWRFDSELATAVKLEITADDDERLLGRILDAAYELYDEGLYLLSVNAEIEGGKTAHITLVVYASYQTLERFNESLLHMKSTQSRPFASMQIKELELGPSEQYTIVSAARLATRDRLDNPYTFGPAEMRTFKGREDSIDRTIEWIKDIRQKQAVRVLYGIKRIGKTSFLKNLRSIIQGNTQLKNLRSIMQENTHLKVIPVLVDMQEIGETMASAFWSILARSVLRDTQAMMGTVATEPVHPNTKIPPRLSFQDFDAWQQEILRSLPQYRWLIMIDEFNIFEEWKDREQARTTVYNLKRMIENCNLGNDRKISMILCVQKGHFDRVQDEQRARTSDSMPSVTGHLLDTMDPEHLDYLSGSAAEKVIREPVAQIRWTQEVVNEIKEATGGHPLYLNYLLRRLILRANERGAISIDTYDLKAIYQDLVQSGDLPFQFFERQARGYPMQILSAIARVEKYEARLTTLQDLERLLKPRHFEQRIALQQGIRHLGSVGILAFHAGLETEFRIRVPLFREWVLQRYPFDLEVLGEVFGEVFGGGMS